MTFSYSDEYLKRVARVHRENGLGFTYANRKGKQYVTIKNKGGIKFARYWLNHVELNSHIRQLFTESHCYVTSGSWGGDRFDVTYRINQ